ncbi:hypothetical protein B4U80_12917 [Leptotrombidium deliense]|uniref:Uncharacterized protein n=1 Tax=Leptotrombidium deliense TaxID=299467 RepID=A0A443SHA8_9ACAR|nr:hypothetical protein B4U80_12917 [Leptotrombidium deliense]
MNYWLHEMKNDELARECKLYICSTKFDLIESSEQSFALEAMKLKAKLMKTQFFVTSSKTGEGIESMFTQIVKDMIKTLEYDCISSNEIEGKSEFKIAMQAKLNMHGKVKTMGAVLRFFTCLTLTLNNLLTVSRSLPDSPTRSKQWKQWIPKTRSHTVAE